MAKKLQIALLGTRGIPANYGGFETFAEELSTRLVERGHEVTVYCRCSFGEKVSKEGEYKGVKLRTLPTIRHKYLDTVFHTFLSFIDLIFRRFDVVLLCNAANSPFAWIARLRGFPLAINVDGVERRRTKWNAFGRLWYKLGERCSVWFANRIVGDAKIIHDYYKEEFNAESEIIAYGALVDKKEPGPVLSEFGIEKDKYVLYVSRLEPENNALGVIQAYNSLDTDIPLVIVGDAPYADSYKNQLKQEAGSGVIFTGFQFGDAYKELRTNCMFYVQATEVGGTHPALVESMAYGNAVIANDVPEHVEVLEDGGLYYFKNDFSSLAERMKVLLEDSAKRTELSKKASALAEQKYTWNQIVGQYEDLFYRLLD